MEISFTSEITVELTGQYGTDSDICHAAWVSTGTEMKTEPTQERQEKLLWDLMSKKHGSPFEEGFWRFRIYAPRGVRDEHVRHRIGSYSSASSRYREIPPVFYIPPPHRPLKKVEGFKKMAPQYVPYTFKEYERYQEHMINMYLGMHLATNTLKEEGFDTTEAIRWGNPDGQMIPYIARFNPRMIMAFLELRTHDPNANHPSYPMWEIEQVARQIEAHFAEHLPITYKLFNKAGREAP